MKLLVFAITWLRRLPAAFTTLFAVCMLLYLLLVSAAVKAGGVQTISDLARTLLGIPDIPTVGGFDAAARVFWEGIIIVFLLLVGVLASYNTSAWTYRYVRRRPRPLCGAPTTPVPGTGKRLTKFNRIGIILAGGGAKGAYQAGALKAIHEFLEANGALSKVKMIAGTSIGSWNSMFWLADLIKTPADGGPSLHEQWWRSINAGRIMEFASFWPLSTNHFLRATPWRETFRQIFAEQKDVADHMARLFPAASGDPPIHFYFTRSNVERGVLEFATNWPGIAHLTRPQLRTADPDDREAVVAPDLYEVIAGDLADAMARTERAVFASMDLPPLFPYVSIKLDMTEWFEDGGVVDNLPVWFGTQIEHCDLLFVLPLNASFAAPVDHASVIHRMARVMDVRQGVIERNALKLTYLYNELAALRNRVEELGGESYVTRVSSASMASPPADPGENATLETRAGLRKHDPISVFSICPAPPLGIGTAEFWKPKEAGLAFELMYAATKYELAENFEADTNPNWLKMTLVSPRGERTQTDEF
ncbi:MAG: hypothetical protein EXR93_12325 [Gemmatimonadetes bacterium]|nr:hypothetical protein [Gemmatimonadota bacterium]